MMFVMIWAEVVLTNSFLNGGHCVVIAASLERARELLLEDERVGVGSEVFTQDPTETHEIVGSPPESLYVMADAGRC